MARKIDSTDPPEKALPGSVSPCLRTSTWLEGMMSVPADT